MSCNIRDFLLKLFKHKSQAMNAGNAMHRKNNICGLCALCGEITR